MIENDERETIQAMQRNNQQRRPRNFRLSTSFFAIPNGVSISSIQFTMIMTLSKLFDVEFDREQARLMSIKQTEKFIERINNPSSIWESIPIIGKIVRGVDISTATEELGWKVANNFAKRQENK